MLALCTSKAAGSAVSTFWRDAAGDVKFIRCYYFKLWMPVSITGEDGEPQAVFGPKGNSASGYSTLSRLGTSCRTTQQKDYRTAKENLLTQVVNGEVLPHEIAEQLDAFEVTRKEIHLKVLDGKNIPTFETLNEAIEHYYEA